MHTSDLHGRGRRRERRIGKFLLEPAYYVDAPAVIDPEQPLSVVVCLHGMGQSAMAFQERFEGRLETPGRLVLYPDAPLVYEAGDAESPRREGHSWYVYTGDQEAFLASARRAEDYLTNLLDEIGRDWPIDRGRVTLLGYSQGGYLAGIMALRQPSLYAGLVTIASRIKVETLKNREIGSATPAVLALHGQSDPLIPVAAAEDSARRLAERGFAVDFRAFDCGHRMTSEMIEGCVHWLAEKDAPADASSS